MSDPYPDLEPWEAYETACQRIAYLEAQLAEAMELLCPEEDLMGNQTENWLERRGAAWWARWARSE